MESQRVENEKAAKAAMAKFDEAARRATVSAGRACSTYLSRALPTFSQGCAALRFGDHGRLEQVKPPSWDRPSTLQ